MYESGFYFRLKDNNASIFRINKTNANAGATLDHIGVIVFQSGKIKLHDEETITPEEEAEIQVWLERYKTRTAGLARFQVFDLIKEINNITQWVQSDANDEDIKDVFEDLLLALHDLRQTCVKRYTKALESRPKASS